MKEECAGQKKKKGQVLYQFVHIIYRGSYMSAHVLLNLLNELRKRDKCAFYRFFATSIINSINHNTGARMLHSIYHMTLKSHLSRENIKILHLLRNIINYNVRQCIMLLDL